MYKKIMSILLVATFAISGLFAYGTPRIILNVNAEEVDYHFKIQRLNSSMTNYEDFGELYTENITLSSQVGETNAFTIATTANGNNASDITFVAEVTTGAFLDSEDPTFNTGWYPMIVELSESATETNDERGHEVVTYSSVSAGNFTSESKGTFHTTFTRGIHPFGTEIARFKLQYKADGNLIAGSYSSTTIISIGVE